MRTILNFDPVHAAPSTPIVANNDATITEDEPLYLTPTPATPVASTHQQPIDCPPTKLQRLSNLVNTIKTNASTSIALISGAIGLAAAVEDPFCLPQLSELGNGLTGLMCAGGIVMGVVALENVAEGVDADVEEAWGKVWRWVKDKISGPRTPGGEEGEGGEGQEVEEVMMFDDEGRSAFLRDTPPATPPSMQDDSGDSLAVPATPPAQQSSERGSSRRSGCPALPAFTFPPLPDTRAINSPPSPPQQEYAYTSSTMQPALNHPVPRRRAEHDASNLLHFHTYADGTHASGILGASPMPARRTTQSEWQHFTGQGLHKHEQKLKAVNLWAVPGRRNRTFDEILKEVGEMDNKVRQRE